MSRKDTVKSFIQKIQRILEYYPINLNLKRKEIRAWKNFDYESFIKSYKIFDEKQLISVSNSILLDGASKFEVYKLFIILISIFKKSLGC